MLAIEGLDLAAGSFRLKGVSLTVDPGESVALVGPSGAGKSVLLSAVLGLKPPVRGRILLDGEEVTGLPTERRRLGYLPQSLGLFPHLSVAQNVAYGARARGLSPEGVGPLIRRLAEETGIVGLLDRSPATLSGGEKQRVALVRALVGEPRVLLLDEPFSALDDELRRELWWLVRALQRERDLSILLVTHSLTEAHVLARRVGVLVDGRLEQLGPAEEVFRRPATLPVARFLGVRNLLPGRVARASDDGVEIDCPLLGRTVRLPPGSAAAAPGTPLLLGILPEEVMLRDAAHPPKEDETLLYPGRVELLDLGTQALLRFRASDRPLELEIRIGRRVAERFGLTNGVSEVTVALPEAAFFCLAER